MQPAIPNSFMPYKQDILEQVEEFSEDVRNFLQDSVDTLIEDKKLLPSQCIHENLLNLLTYYVKQIEKVVNTIGKGNLQGPYAFARY